MKNIIPIEKSQLNTSARFGTRTFPTRSNYEDYFLKKGVIQTSAELWDDDALVSEVHRHWHTSGQNGCVFAQNLARNQTMYGWESFVINESLERIAHSDIRESITQRIQEGITSPDCQVLSLLFPQIVEEADLITLIHILIDTPPIFLDHETEHGEFITLALRVDVTGTRVLSWLMSFAPFAFYPNTRIAPIVEVTIRTKPKPEEIFERLNHDRDAAHLADVPLVGMSDQVAHSVWEATLKNTRDVLGEEPNDLSAAKSTFVLPKSLWSPITAS